MGSIKSINKTATDRDKNLIPICFTIILLAVQEYATTLLQVFYR